MYRNGIKRGMDLFLSLIAIVALSPLILILAILIKTKIGSPILFQQERPGKNEKSFIMYKFRTMTNEQDVLGNLLPDEQRMTKFGLFLRNTSLDELPELFNILKGNMSIVGPRPLLMEYLTLYDEQQKHRHDVRPGLSGLAQISGRNSLAWEDKFELDIQYVEKMSFLLDCKIILLTLWKAFVKREGISSEDCVTMKNFTGREHING